MSAARTTISMPDDMYTRAQARQVELGYASFSDYIQALIRADALQSGPHIRESANPPPPPPMPPAQPVTYRKASKKDIRRKIRDAVLKKVDQVKSSQSPQK